MSGKAKFRLLLLLTLAGILGYVGFLVFKERDPLPPYLSAERIYNQDAKSLEKQEEYQEAANRYDQAAILLEHAYERFKGPHGLDEEKARDVAGKILYLKAKAIRDKHYALALAAKKPLPETSDTVTGETYRDIHAIPSEKDREAAAASLRGAAQFFLVKNYDVQLDSLRLALRTNPLPWEQIERSCKAILEVKSDDSRAKYMLAKFDFEQPDPVTNQPAPPEKRSLERIKTALAYTDDVRRDRKFPIWRTEFLRAKIRFWLMNNHAQNNREKDRDNELLTLDSDLLDDSKGALARIRQGEGLERLGPWDSEAVLGLHTLAADVVIEEVRKKKAEPKALERVYDDTLHFVREKYEAKDPAFPPALLIASLLNLMSDGQKMLALQQPLLWQSGIDFLRPALREEFKQNRCDPYRVAQFAELLMRESQIEPRRGGTKKKADEFAVEAKKWLDDGMKFGREHGYSNVRMMPFNILAANICYFNNEKRDQAEKFIRALYDTRHPQAQVTALVVDGAYDEREGRLLRAEEKFEQALKIKIKGGEDDIRAHASLANIYMAMGQPNKALVSLVNLQQVYDHYGDLTDHEKEWLYIFLRSPQDYYALTAIASMEDARRRIAEHFIKNPRDKRYPPELVRDLEDRIRGFLGRELALPFTGPGFITRTAWIYHLILTNRRNEAEERWNELNKDFSDRIQMVQLKVAMLEQQAYTSGDSRAIQALPAEGDKVILAFIKANPNNQSARLYYATWQAQTGRGDQALASLKEIIDTTSMTPELRRVAAAIILSVNSGSNPLGIVRHLPRNPQIDSALFNLTLNSDAKRSEVRDALLRHETVGLTRVMKAEDLYAAGKFADAADAFAKTLDFTRVKSLGEQGLIRSMFSLARKDPDEALNTIRQISAQYPKEPAVLLSYAYVFLIRDEIGNPNDDWERTGRNMASALVEWEHHLNNRWDRNPVAIALTKAEFWFYANRLDVALNQAKRALSHDPQNTNALGVCAAMILDDPGRDRRPELKSFVDELNRVAPDSPATRRINARVAEDSGDWQKAAKIYEQLLEKSPGDRGSYVQLIRALDKAGDYVRAAKWASLWRQRIPNDLDAVTAEVQMLARQGDLKGARDVADQFIQKAQERALKIAESVKDPAVKVEIAEAARWSPQIDIARGFFAAGSTNEAESRLVQLPKAFLNRQAAQELLAEIAIKQGNWAKAEAILESILQNDPSNLFVANNLAYVLTYKANKPNRAREVLLAATKTGPRSLSTRSWERMPPEFLAMLGAAYARIGSPEHGKEVLDIFRAATQRYPHDPRIELYMGYGFEISGEEKRARDYYQRAMKNSDRVSLSHEQRRVFLEEASAFLERVDRKLNIVER